MAVLALAAAGCGDNGGADEAPADTATEQATAAGCKTVKQPKARPDGSERKPSEKLDAAKTYDVTMATNCGKFTIRLDVKASPQTAASFVSLARKGFFDGTVFHRIVPGFVIQGGDPTASGSGGPGYSTRDVPPKDAKYTKGVVAMAKTGPEPAGTAGSQFYVVTGEDAALPPEYAILGKVTRGLEVAERIGELGDPASGGAGTPTQTVVVEKASVTG